MRVLGCFTGFRKFYRPVMLADDEIFCGPQCETRMDEGIGKCLKTPSANYDIASLASELPSGWQPDLLVVKTDATGANFPRNLKSLLCPKVLILGDTHHLDQPIRTLLDYADDESFDLIISDHDRQHLHFFLEAGHPQVAWLPAFNINPFVMPTDLPKQHNVSFVGQVGPYHPYRSYMLKHLADNGIEINQCLVPQKAAAEIYATSVISLNCSLNADLNLRVFEVLASGGFLLTDSAGLESGLEDLFQVGTHLEVYRNEVELREKIEFYLAHPDKAATIAQAGHELYLKEHTPSHKIRHLVDLLEGREIAPKYSLKRDKRTAKECTSATHVHSRIAIYEYLQELHWRNPETKILFSPDVDAHIFEDARDLPRARFVSIENADEGSYSAFLGTSQFFDKCDLTSLFKAYEFDEVILTPTISQSTLVEPTEHSQLALCGFCCINLERQIYRSKALWKLGVFFEKSNEVVAAARTYEKALQRLPDCPDATLGLARLTERCGREKESAHFFYRALELDRQNRSALLGWANILHKNGEGAKCVPLLERWLLKHLNDVPVQTLMQEICGEIKPAQEKRKLPSTSAKRETVLLVTNLFPPQELGGYGRLMFDFARILRQRGQQVIVLSGDAPYLAKKNDDDPELFRHLNLAGKWVDGKTQALGDEEYCLKTYEQNRDIVEQFIEQWKPTACLLGNLDFIGPELMAPLLLAKIPIVQHLGNRAVGYPVKETPTSGYYCLATASDWLRQEVRKQGYTIKNLEVIYPGADVQHFLMPLPPPKDKLRLMYASLVLPFKGVQTLVEAACILHQNKIDFHCTIAGGSTDPAFVKKLKHYVAKNGMDSKVVFTGNLERDELYGLYARHNVLVFPSIFEEPFGISQVEAMAAEVAVVGTGTGGSSEIVSEDCARLFPAKDSLKLAETLCELQNNPSEWTALVQKGRERALERFDIECSVDKLQNLFSTLSDSSLGAT